MITLEVYLKENQNLHHPKAGWYKAGTFETVKKAAECYDRAETIRARANKPLIVPYRIIISEESIKTQFKRA